MTPYQKLKWAILEAADCCAVDGVRVPITEDNIDELYERAADEKDSLADARYEMRHGEVETGLPCPYSRHYESKSVAAKIPDGSWVGWTYWFGGGKHGEPGFIDWMDKAYDLHMREEMQPVKIFSMVEA